MADCARNRKRREQIAAVDSESSTISFSKKMKIQIDFAFDEVTSPSHQDRRFSPALSTDKIVSPETPSDSGGFSTGDVFSGEFIACRTFSVDLEAKSFETESSTCIDNKFSRETTPSSEFYTGEMESLVKGDSKSCRNNLPAKNVPNQEEIDQFFAEAEKKEQKRFADKYNFDVVKDLPLEGRYQWVRLN